MLLIGNRLRGRWLLRLLTVALISGGILALTTGIFKAAQLATYTATLANGGVLNDHHGVGLKLSRLVKEQYGPAIQVLQALKKELDPNGIMNPYKLGL